MQRTTMFGYMITLERTDEGYTRCDINSPTDYVSLDEVEHFQPCKNTVWHNDSDISLNGDQVYAIKEWAYSNGY